jgi:hypothetical protein
MTLASLLHKSQRQCRQFTERNRLVHALGELICKWQEPLNSPST